jgi:hypothetical protein
MIKNLLSNTSGLANYTTEDKTKPGGAINLRADYGEQELVRIIESFPLQFQPGEKWAYCNSNYVLLGALIHKVSGKFYGDFLQERIFKSLGMTATRVISEADLVPHRSAGYRLVEQELKNQEWVSPSFNTTADGALYLNVLDLAKWDGALYTDKLLKKSSLDLMWSVFKLNSGKPNSSNYGFGWYVDEIDGHRVIEHGGNWQGFTSFIGRYVDDRLTVVLLTNLNAVTFHPRQIAHHVAGLYNPSLEPPPRKPIPDNDPLITSLIKSFIEEMRTQGSAPEKFTAEFRLTTAPSDLREWHDRFAEAGPLQSLELLKREPDGDQVTHSYRVKFAKAAFILNMTLDRSNKISELEGSLE